MANEKTITVKSNLPAGEDGSTPVALWEKNPAHPDGEVFITGDKTFEVAETSEVMGALRDERLVKVEKSGKPADAKP